jgi:GT2 family glycosyltransferase
MPRFINNTGRNITVIYKGKKSVVAPNQTIDGPIQLSIYGLTVYQNLIEVNKPVNVIFKKNNCKEILECLDNYKGLPSVGICILTKDSYDLISDCVESIFKRVRYPNTKIYIFDTGTTDQKVLSYYNEIKNKKIPVEVVNVGPFYYSKNYNDGIKLTDTEYVLLQNNDTVALNDYVSKLMKISVIPKIGITGPRMLYKNGTIQHDGQVIYDHNRKTFGIVTHLHLKTNPSEIKTGRHWVDGITAAGLLIKKDLYTLSGGLSEEYKDIFQDVDFNIKIANMGYKIMCDRDSVIYHYDNTSRKGAGEFDHNKLKIIRQDAFNLQSNFVKNYKYPEQSKKKFSIVTLVHNKKQYRDFVEDLSKQNINEEFEVIPLFNFNNEYKGCSEALNIGLDVSDGEHIILCHQDLRVNENWLSNISQKISKLNHSKINWGVLGMAGGYSGNVEKALTFLTNDSAINLYRQRYGDISECQCIDELCLIVKNGNSIRFDEKVFDHYHVYGADFCLQYMLYGFKNFVIDAECVHISNGMDNLKNPEHLSRFVLDYIKLYKKWNSKIQKLRTTTIHMDFVNKQLYLLVAAPLRKLGVNIDDRIDLSKIN